MSSVPSASMWYWRKVEMTSHSPCPPWAWPWFGKPQQLPMIQNHRSPTNQKFCNNPKNNIQIRLCQKIGGCRSCPAFFKSWLSIQNCAMHNIIYLGSTTLSNTYISFDIHIAYPREFAGRNISSFVCHSRFLFARKNIFDCSTLHIQSKIVPSAQSIAFNTTHPTLRETHPRWSCRQGKKHQFWFFCHTLFLIFWVRILPWYTFCPARGFTIALARGEKWGSEKKGD